MRVAIKRWGNSATVRIPRPVMDAASLNLDQIVDVREEKGRIIIEPVRQPRCDLNEVIEAITRENLHEPIDFGKPVGNELW